jgi:hypothetical protein
LALRFPSNWAELLRSFAVDLAYCRAGFPLPEADEKRPTLETTADPGKGNSIFFDAQPKFYPGSWLLRFLRFSVVFIR